MSHLYSMREFLFQADCRSYSINFISLNYILLPIASQSILSNDICLHPALSHDIPLYPRPIHTPDPYQNAGNPDKSKHLDHRGQIHIRNFMQPHIYYIILYYIILYYIMLCYVMLCYIILCIYYVMLCYIILYYVMLYYVI